ncbi:MAG: RHS repeat-associated core domain-containing protein [Candidatus Limnocylindrales bacterium]
MKRPPPGLTGTTQTYTYSGDGVRLSAATGSQAAKTVRYVVDRAFALPTVVAETDGNGNLLRRYVYGLALLNQTTPNKGPYWYHEDGLGSVSDITSSAGTPLWWAEYQPYGQLRASGSTSQAPLNPFLFTGPYYLRARQYDPTAGRFLAVDPVSALATSPYGSAYAYVGHNPTNAVDPSGRCWPICFAVVGGIVGGALGGAASLATNWGHVTAGGLAGAVGGGAIAGAATAVASTPAPSSRPACSRRCWGHSGAPTPGPSRASRR